MNGFRYQDVWIPESGQVFRFTGFPVHRYKKYVGVCREQTRKPANPRTDYEPEDREPFLNSVGVRPVIFLKAV